MCSDVKRLQAVVENVVRKTIKARPSFSQPVTHAMTYADKAKIDTPQVAPDVVRPLSNMVRIFPPKDKEQNSDATKRTVISIAKPAQSQIRITVETECKEDLAAFIGSSKLKEAGLSVYFPMMKNPTFIVYDISKGMKREEVQESGSKIFPT